MLSGGGQEHPQEDIICPFSDTDYAKKSKEEVLRREDMSPYKAEQGWPRQCSLCLPVWYYIYAFVL